jgi:hypothetical protein
MHESFSLDFLFEIRIYHMMDLLRIMELVFVILEAGHTIKELHVKNNDAVEMVIGRVGMDDITVIWTVSSNDIYDKLNDLGIIAQTESLKYKMRFYDPLHSTPATPSNKTIATMRFILGAMSSGWKVRKSFGKKHYTFNKTHHYHKKYLNGSFLSRFLKQNALR